MVGPDPAQLVRDALAFEGVLAAGDLEVRFADGVVILSGIAFSEDTRRRAEHVAYQVAGVKRVVNQVLVVPVRPG